MPPYLMLLFSLFSACSVTHSFPFTYSCMPLQDTLHDASLHHCQLRAQAILSNSLQQMPLEVILKDLCESYSPTWDSVNVFQKLKKSKNSTIKKNKPTHHYGSQGYSYSFGLRNDYSKIRDDNPSITHYAGDQDESMAGYIKFIGHNLAMCLKSFDSLLPSILSYINLTCRSFK